MQLIWYLFVDVVLSNVLWDSTTHNKSDKCVRLNPLGWLQSKMGAASLRPSVYFVTLGRFGGNFEEALAKEK